MAAWVGVDLSEAWLIVAENLYAYHPRPEKKSF